MACITCHTISLIQRVTCYGGSPLNKKISMPHLQPLFDSSPIVGSSTVHSGSRSAEKNNPVQSNQQELRNLIQPMRIVERGRTAHHNPHTSSAPTPQRSMSESFRSSIFGQSPPPNVYIAMIAPHDFHYSPFIEREILHRDVHYRHDDAINYNRKVDRINYSAKNLIPIYMQRVTYAWHKQCILHGNNVLFDHARYHVTRDDAIGLLHGRETPTYVVDAIIHITQCFVNEPNSRWQFVRSDLTYTVPNLPKQMLNRPEYAMFSRTSLNECRWLLIPVCYGGNAWFVIVTDFLERGMKYYSTSSTSMQLKNIITICLSLWKTILRQVMDQSDIDRWEVREGTCPKTMNGSEDCGVSAAKIIDLLASHRTLRWLPDVIRGDRGRIVYNLIAANFSPESFQ